MKDLIKCAIEQQGVASPCHVGEVDIGAVSEDDARIAAEMFPPDSEWSRAWLRAANRLRLIHERDELSAEIAPRLVAALDAGDLAAAQALAAEVATLELLAAGPGAWCMLHAELKKARCL